ncbi:bundle-forming pilus pre-pilin peptidase BfpP [Escherichia coli]|uniref:bundle-forming pilus pre-pilin peptidase BfpP n=1 Tax=Escherichia coli TaxID=562 RepID=UPI00028E009A|nr:bundle-forming pilus pre-pilin peptidase BfpP [Escherichia coli]EIJ2839211.1 bundle-forming pilus pre-pilin peptidase BfpP [Salmonella enterica]EEW2719442.1 bundle-forming pilus pre-pilin peptidase BfpP [Escherichia coli]EFB5295172.1 bundle-forming pilus pre-pilin peptidase BfpP [Escherichia coli]EFE7330962.1 bundle-forming pilus pre-pilin peptidase BfpP [Escherichia coli]EFK3963156.1 bundle-forming pilus pre-pilin peptidase BfpP [Escherichia coli]
MQESIFLLLVFIYAATITSFIWLAVERLPHQLKWVDNPVSDITIWSPGSKCNNCGKKIRWYYLIPVLGYFLCRGECGYCHAKVPVRYPLTEFICGVCCVIIFVFLGDRLYDAVIVSLLFLCLVFLALIDLRENWLPACVTYPLFWAGMITPGFASSDDKIFGAFAGFLIMYISMKLVSALRKEDVFAGGDIALATAAGAWLGIDKMPFFLILSSFIFILYSLPARLRGQVFVPMGPALSASFFICLVYH